MLLNNFVNSYDPTIEDWYYKELQIDSQVCTLQVLDTSGHKEHSTLRPQ
jgi:GTPase KRas